MAKEGKGEKYKSDGFWGTENHNIAAIAAGE